MRIPLFVGSSYKGQSIVAANEELFNLYPELQVGGGTTKRMVYYGIPGRTLLSTLAGARWRAQFAQDGRAFGVVGTTFYEIDSAGVGTSRGTVVDDGRMATIHSNGKQLMVISGRKGYIFTLATNVFAEITDPQFPSGVLMGEHMDQYFIVLTADNFALSALSDGTNWAADTGTNDTGDKLVAIKRIGTVLWVFGSAYAIPWYNSGAAAFPFEPVPGITLQHGCAAEFGVAGFDNSIAWVDQNSDGDRLVMFAEQYSPRRISTHAMETALRGYSTISDVVTWTYTDEGHAFAVLTFPMADATWVYDAASQLWHRRSFFNTTTGRDEADHGICHMRAFGKHFVGDQANGKLYEQSLAVYDDNGAPLRRLRRIPLPTNELNRLTIHRVHLDCEPGVSLTTGQGSDAQIMARLSRDGGKTWGSERWQSIGALGDYGTIVDWHRFGEARRPVLEFAQTDPVKTVWLDGYVDGEAASS